MLLVTLLIAIPVGAGLLALDLFQVRAALQNARASLSEAVVAISEVDLSRANTALEAADHELARARDHSSGPLWAVASVTPFVRDATTTTQQVVEVASAAVDLGQTALTEGEPIIRDGLAIGVDDGRIDLEPLRDAGELLASLPVERLVAARDQLAEPRSGWTPEVLWDARADSLQLADRTIDSVTHAQEVTAVLPGFLGADGPRRYFVGVQTSAELRGTGGLIGFWGILSADDGQLEFGDSEVYEALDEVGGAPPDGTAVERIGSLLGPLRRGRRRRPGVPGPLRRPGGQQLLLQRQPRPRPADHGPGGARPLRAADRRDPRRHDPARPGRTPTAAVRDRSELPVPPEVAAPLGWRHRCRPTGSRSW
jgi:hypothetical protein